MAKTTVKIPSATRGWSLDAWQYLPERKNPPVIVMAHGFSGTKAMQLEPFAERFVKLGYGVVLFDYRFFGLSDGEPRNFLSVNDQLQDYRTVIAWTRRSGSPFDGTRVVVFGSSYSGGHATRLATESDLGLVAAVGQCPFTNPILTAAKLSPMSTLRCIALTPFDFARRKLGGKPVYIDAVGEPGELGALSSKGVREAYAGMLASPEDHTNRAQACVVWETASYWPVMRPSTIKIPLYITICETDEMCPAWYTKRLVEGAPKGEYKMVKGSHFDVYPPKPDYEASVTGMCEFLQKHVPV